MVPPLPPSGGGGNKFSDILPFVLTASALTLFFLSPLGGLFFAVTNTLFVLAILTPIAFIIGFQLWSAFNTLEGTCPNCGAKVVVLKSSYDSNLCLNCGSLIRATADNKGVELCNAPPSDEFFDIDSGNGGLFDIFGSPPTSTSQGGKSMVDKKKIKRERTIIDVDIEED